MYNTSAVETIKGGPVEPCTHQRADELLKYLSDLESESLRLHSILFGPVEQGKDAQKANPSLDAKVAEACTKAAMLCGFMRTVNDRLAG